MKTTIRKCIVAGNLLFALTMATHAYAGDVSDTNLEPLQAHTVNMTNCTAVVYYTILDNGDYQVITAIGPNAEIDGQMTQHRVTIEPGQSYEMSMDSGVAGVPANTIRFTANKDVLFSSKSII